MENNNLESLIKEGKQALDRGDYQEALNLFEQAIQLNPKSENVWHCEGVVLRELKEYEKAIQCFDYAIEINARYEYAWHSKGNVLSDLKKYEYAIKCYDKAIQINPHQYANFYFNKGSILCNQLFQQYQEAITCFDEALKIDSQHEDALYYKGIILCDQLFQYREAITCFDELLKITFQYAVACWHNKGIALYHLKEYENAIQCHDKALEINPKFEDAWYYRGRILGQLKKYEQEIECYNHLLAINPQCENAWFDQGCAWKDLGEYEKQIECYDKALKINPQHEFALNAKGVALGKLQQYEKATHYFDTILKINPQSENAWKNKSICLWEQRLYQNALENYDQGLQHQDPQNPKHQKICGFLYWQKGIKSFELADMQNTSTYRQYYRDRAIDSYQSALEFFLFEPDPEIKFQAFPEKHLEVCRDLIKVCRYTRPDEVTEMIRQVDDLLARFLANPDYSESRKIAIQRKLANYQQLRIDDLIQSGKNIEALELAEKRKNDCLKWLLSPDSQKIISPQYSEIATLLNPHTAAIYWHISPTAISAFILKYQQEPIVKTVLFQPTNLTDNLQRFESWLDQWLKNYDDYCQSAKSQNNTSQNKENHPWRKTMDDQIAELRDILKIENICQDLDGITNLILIPHRSLHTLPLEILFPEEYTITRLPSAKVGIDQQTFAPLTNPTLLLVEQVGQNKGKNTQRNLTFAQIEAIALQKLYKINHHLQEDINTEQVLENLLNPNINLFHFTGHAQHNTSNPSKSALMLNSGEQLTMIDIYQQINKCQQYYQLACLNGCETGITNREDLTDEFIGLASAFLPKTQYVISSLWRVDDRTSTLLMIEFYRLLQVEKMNTIQALNQAKYWLRDLTNGKLADWYDQILMPLMPDQTIQVYLQRESQRLKKFDIIETSPYQPPYYWAGFIIHGSFV